MNPIELQAIVRDRLERIDRRATSRGVLVGENDWRAWEGEMRDPAIPQDAIKYLEGEPA